MAYNWLNAALRLTFLGFVSVTGAGCSLTSSTTTLRTALGPAVEQHRLQRADTNAVTGAFQQQGHAIIGQLAFTADCVTQSTRPVYRQEVTDRRTNRAAATAWTVAGGVIVAAGVGMLVASSSADQQVNCGQMQAGDQCQSEASALQTVGFATLLAGLIPIGSGLIFLAQKPRTETKDLPSEAIATVEPGAVACGATAELEGLSALVEIPGNGKWTGRAAADGTLRIEINDRIPLLEGSRVMVTVESVPAGIAGLVSPGATLGSLTLGAHAAGNPSARRGMPLRRSVAGR
jgi:hypothetical protein